MKITVIGTGYVGLVTGACFAEMGNTVTCVDIDQRKVDGLKLGVMPIFEPGLDIVVTSNFEANRLHFTTDLASAMKDSNVLFIAVGTPPDEDGSADLKYVLAVAKEIGQHINEYSVVVDKSTVPVGTAELVERTIRNELIQRGVDVEFDVISNPEFLKEGAAVGDFMSPDRIIVGTNSDRARKVMTELYAPFNRSHPRTVFMGVRDAEMTKYAANAMLATKISFMNEIACLCDRMNVDVENVRIGIGSDQRIGFHFIYPGAGYGGSCFPKDVKALLDMSKKLKYEPHLLQAVEDRNQEQKQVLFEKISKRFSFGLSGLRFAVWGLSFKPGTDDMRDAPSVVLIKSLIKAGATVNAFDPVAGESAKFYLADELASSQLNIKESQYAVLDGASALILVSEWKQFKNPDFDKIKKLLIEPVIFDGRNQYDLNLMHNLQFEYFGIGRSANS